MKIFFRNIHLYLSLLCGLVILLVCFSGAAMVFEKEMQMMIYPERYHVEKGTSRVPLEQMTKELRGVLPKAKIVSAKMYDDPTRSVEITYSEGKETRGGNKQAFMNPYTGKLISLYEHRSSFFYAMMALHRWLLVEGPGKLIVGISTVVFLFILITGIILWWPKNKRLLKQHITLRWGAGWKRINHDLHIVVGFYTAIFLFIFAFTGLAWSFEWFNDGIYWITGTKNQPPKPPASVVVEGAPSITLDSAYRIASARIPNAEYYVINRPRDPKGSMQVTFMPKDAVHERASGQIHIDQYSGNVLAVQRFEDRNLGQQVRATFYPVHVGSIGGMPGRIIAFICCVAGVTFPVTGTIMWIIRLRRKKKKSTAHVANGHTALRAEKMKEEEVMM